MDLKFEEKRTIYAGDPDREFVILGRGESEQPLPVSRKGWVAWGSVDRTDDEAALEFLDDDAIEEAIPAIIEGFKLPETRDKVRALFATSAQDGDQPF